ncbi:hypothetical protein [Nocardioides xinjiangensis]|nr:hypothetical protein [Nocardioides sp. SYSU D00514]
MIELFGYRCEVDRKANLPAAERDSATTNAQRLGVGCSPDLRRPV